MAARPTLPGPPPSFCFPRRPLKPTSSGLMSQMTCVFPLTAPLAALPPVLAEASEPCVARTAWLGLPGTGGSARSQTMRKFACIRSPLRSLMTTRPLSGRLERTAQLRQQSARQHAARGTQSMVATCVPQPSAPSPSGQARLRGSRHSTRHVSSGASHMSLQGQLPLLRRSSCDALAASFGGAPARTWSAQGRQRPPGSAVQKVSPCSLRRTPSSLPHSPSQPPQRPAHATRGTG
mmetsp:Transcript_46858/g.102336  ORF Transcript_46858/g.102336 Transcript_46858/m.102336 type:complete len:235 (-) Transcript_46858:1356-2060(-)